MEDSKRKVGRPKLDPKLKQKNRVQIKLDSETYQSLINHCIDKGITVSWLLKSLINETLRR